MVAPVGNEFWKKRQKSGKPPALKPEEVAEGAEGYFKWVAENPIIEQKATQSNGEQVTLNIEKPRVMTKSGLYLYLGISETTWYEYAKKDDYAEVMSKIEQTIKDQKFAGAAADVFNAAFIAKNLDGGARFQVKVAKNASNDEKASAILLAAMDGEIPMSTAENYMSLIEKAMRIKDIDDLDKRLTALEEMSSGTGE